MKYLVFFGLAVLTHLVSAQSVKLTNAVVITQFDKEEDRYAMQALMADILKGYQIKALPVMNVLKQGEDPQHLWPNTEEGRAGLVQGGVVLAVGVGELLAAVEQKDVFHGCLRTRMAAG